MLALPPRRQHLSPQQQHHSSTSTSTSTLPSPPSSHSQQLSFDQLSQQFSASPFYDQNQKLLHDYLESQQQQSFGNLVGGSLPSQFMPASYGNFATNPTIRIQQSTPTPHLTSTAFPQSSMLSTNVADWNSYNNVQGSQSLQTPVQTQSRGHQRASSSSSIGSNGSQYQSVGPTASYQTFSNHLPTPTHTPTQDSFMNASNFNNYTPTSSSMDQTMAAHMSMKQALMDQGDDVPDFAHSARQSVSSYGHDSPATPHTAQGDDMDFKIPPTDMRQHTVPKFERTFTDVAADNFYDPSAVVAQTQSMSQSKPNVSLLSPYRSNTNENVQRALQAANYARSQSPSSSISRGGSPFRRSPYHQPSNNFNSPRMRVGTVAEAREQSVQADAAYAMKSQLQSNEEAQPKTISPKDALLDYREADEDSKVPLFPDSGASEYDHQYNGGDQYRNATQTNFDAASTQSFRRDSWATPQFSSNFATSAASQPATSFAFVPPSIQGNIHGLQFGSHYRSTPTSMPAAADQTPEFPAHLTSMESSASEAEPPNGSQGSERFLQKPVSSNADSGTYSCTYHGCAQRFETPQKLQKHKREGHRNVNAATLGSGMTSAALLERNSQAGPHKCERINPTTGKPCNTIFSRPYDLTRHEDTIHNARKQKVRCALCVEEKTFSRNDALTRHMRVVHPEVDFPGKHRRRGGNHD